MSDYIRTITPTQCNTRRPRYGRGAEKVVFHDEPLIDYLHKIEKKISSLTDRINKEFAILTTLPVGTKRFNYTLITASYWAHALSMELQPYSPVCRLHNNSDELKTIIIDRLEELFAKICAIAMVFGNKDQKMVCKRLLLDDLIANGGVNFNNGSPGNGLNFTLEMWYRVFVADVFENPTSGKFLEPYFTLLIDLVRTVTQRIPGLSQILRIHFVENFIGVYAKIKRDYRGDKETLHRFIDKVVRVEQKLNM